MHPFTLSNMNISETSRPIKIKFHSEHHCGVGKAALGFGPDRIRALVSMATDSSHRVIWGKSCDHSPLFLIVFALFLQVTWTSIKFQMGSKFSMIQPGTAELAALELLENPHRLNCCDHCSAFIFVWILFILAGNKDNQKSLDKFEFRPDLITYYRVSCP